MLRVIGIFTDIVISPGLSLRQCPDRYAVRAGRNLPDKEFRYLRTVIVTAVVHQDLGSELAPLPVIFWHRTGITPYTSSYEFAESCVFGKQSPEFFRCGLECKVHSRQVLSRSYDRCFAEFLKLSYPVHLNVLTSTHECSITVRLYTFVPEWLFLAPSYHRTLLIPSEEVLGKES